MQTDGFEYLKESCPSVLTELLEYVARFTEHSDIMCKHRNDALLDGSDINGRRVKQRLEYVKNTAQHSVQPSSTLRFKR